MSSGNAYKAPPIKGVCNVETFLKALRRRLPAREHEAVQAGLVDDGERLDLGRSDTLAITEVHFFIVRYIGSHLNRDFQTW